MIQETLGRNSGNASSNANKQGKDYRPGHTHLGLDPARVTDPAAKTARSAYLSDRAVVSVNLTPARDPYFVETLLLRPARPIRPVPTSSMVAGSGTGALPGGT